MAEGTSRTYYGVVHVEYASGVAGLGYIGRPTAMGYDREVDQSRVMAHELGHTWNRLHSPCGQPTGVDPRYPYAGGTIGVYGFDLQDNALRSPSSPDVMGYCGDPWISDYTYAGVLDYRVATQAALAARPSRRPSPACWCGVGIVNGRPVLEPAFEVVTRPSLPKSTWAVPRGGPSHRRVARLRALVRCRGGGGRPARQPSLRVRGPARRGGSRTARVTQARGPAGEVAAARMTPPVAAARMAEAVEARGVAGGVQLRWDAAAHPMIMVRDPATGEVLSLARGGAIDVATVQRALDVVLSDRVGSRAVRVTVGR